MRYRKVHSCRKSNQDDIDKQRSSLWQIKAVQAENPDTFGRCLERKLGARHQHKGSQSQNRSCRKNIFHAEIVVNQICHQWSYGYRKAGKPRGNIIGFCALERLAGINNQRAGKRHLSQPQKCSKQETERQENLKRKPDVPERIQIINYRMANNHT